MAEKIKLKKTEYSDTLEKLRSSVASRGPMNEEDLDQSLQLEQKNFQISNDDKKLA